jgi:hypothetical protein
MSDSDSYVVTVVLGTKTEMILIHLICVLVTVVHLVGWRYCNNSCGTKTKRRRPKALIRRMILLLSLASLHFNLNKERKKKLLSFVRLLQ